MITRIYQIAKNNTRYRGLDSIDTIKRKHSIFIKAFEKCKIYLSEKDKLDLISRLWNNLPSVGNFKKCNQCKKIHSILNLHWFKKPDKTNKVLYICDHCLNKKSYILCEKCHCYHEEKFMYDEEICKNCFTKDILYDIC